MKINKITIKNFRSYKELVTIEVNDLNVFVGKNDIGKSTVLEALDIFFNEGKGTIKLDKQDINKKALIEGNENIEISISFSNPPKAVTIDSTNPTNLKDEYLLNANECLEVKKVYPKAGKEKVFLRAYHPTNSNCSDLITKKNSELKSLLTDGMNCVDKTKNAEIRKTIREFYSDDLNLEEIYIELAKEDAKNIWEKLKEHFPLYTLFQSDRKNSDGDDEVQDPMKLAVKEILKDPQLCQKLDSVAEEVKAKLEKVANNTLNKLNEMNPEISNSLSPIIPSNDSLKWNDVFKNVSFTGDEDILVNKRGSGVKRLILLNFFRAEAERWKNEGNFPNIIYAVEEPETSQHFNHQILLMKAFIEISKSNKSQIFLTTHSSTIVKQLEFNDIKLIKEIDSDKSVIDVVESNLPYPSLNEINYLAFNEINEEYHNELYGFIDLEGKLNDFKSDKPTRQYNKILRNGQIIQVNIIQSEYIRHQIHHPENNNNLRYTQEELYNSINDMRAFISTNIHNV